MTPEELLNLTSEEFSKLPIVDMSPNGNHDCHLCKCCRDCNSCNRCEFCKDCANCLACIGCQDCNNCFNCEYCIGISYGENLLYIVHGVQLTPEQYEQVVNKTNSLVTT